eukprot:gene3742-7426_t
MRVLGYLLFTLLTFINNHLIYNEAASESQMVYNEIPYFPISGIDMDADFLKFCITLDLQDEKCKLIKAKFSDSNNTAQTSNIGLILSSHLDSIVLGLLVRQLEKFPNISLKIITYSSTLISLENTLSYFQITPDIILDLPFPSDMAQCLNPIESILSSSTSSLSSWDMIIIQDMSHFALAATIVAMEHNIPVIQMNAGNGHKLLQFSREKGPTYLNNLLGDVVCALCLTSTSYSRELLLGLGVYPDRIRTTSSLAMEVLMLSIRQLSHFYPNKTFIFYLYYDPGIFTSSIYDSVLQAAQASLNHIYNVELMLSVNYIQLCKVIEGASTVITDSHIGVQEAVYLDKDLVVVGDVTDKVEAVQTGVARRCPLQKSAVVSSVQVAVKAICRYLNIDIPLPPSSSSSSLSNTSASTNVLLEIESEYISPVVTDAVPRLVEDVDSALDTLQTLTVDRHPFTIFHPQSQSRSRRSQSQDINNTVTVVLSVHKSNNTEQQIRSIFAQTAIATVDAILIYQNGNHLDLDFLEYIDFKTPTCPIHIIQSDTLDVKTHGRFTLPLMLDTEYVVVLDDDVMPSPGWLEYSLYIAKEYRAIVGIRGWIVGGDVLYSVRAPVDYTIEVDYLSGGWLFKTEWTKLMWRDAEPSIEDSEDLSLSAAAWRFEGIRSVLPSMSTSQIYVWGEQFTSTSTSSSSAMPSFVSDPNRTRQRWGRLQSWMDVGWVPVALRNAVVSPNTACAPPFPAACKELYDTLFRDKFYDSQPFAPSPVHYLRVEEPAVQSLHLIDTSNRDVCGALDERISGATDEGLKEDLKMKFLLMPLQRSFLRIEEDML